MRAPSPQQKKTAQPHCTVFCKIVNIFNWFTSRNIPVKVRSKARNSRKTRSYFSELFQLRVSNLPHTEIQKLAELEKLGVMTMNQNIPEIFKVRVLGFGYLEQIRKLAVSLQVFQRFISPSFRISV